MMDLGIGGVGKYEKSTWANSLDSTQVQLKTLCNHYLQDSNLVLFLCSEVRGI